MANAARAPTAIVLAGIDGEIGSVVIPGHILPGGYAMAGLAAGWKSQRFVVGIGGCVEIGQMTAIAAGRRAIIFAGMAGSAAHTDMRAGQRITGHRVIIGGGLPGRCAVAARTEVTKVGQRVIGIRAGCKDILVASVAIFGCIVIAAAMTIDAGDGHMSSGQRKRRGSMVECGRLPGGIGMADGTILVKAVADVVGVSHRPEIRLMAAVTILGRTAIGGGVALGATHVDVSSGQRISCSAVVKGAGLPTRNSMARQTGKVEMAHRVVGIALSIVFGFVAAVACL